MKIKTGISIITAVLVILTSCVNQNRKADEHHEHSEHENELPEGVVVLGKAQRDALDLKLGSLQDRNLTTLVKTNGQLEVSPKSKADITAFIGGNVKSIKVFHGDKVSKGQVLATLEHPDYILLQEEFSEAANRLVFLQQEYERQKQLFDNEVGAGKDYQQIKADYKTMQSKYSGLKTRLEMLNMDVKSIENGQIFREIEIKSPISGYVSEVNIKMGAFVDAQTKMFSVSDNSDIHADFQVYEKDIHLLKIGQRIDFTVSNHPEEEFEAKIFAIAKEFQNDTRAVLVHAKIDRPNDNLIPGVYVSGHIHTDQVFTKALPESAVVTEGTKSYIFIKNNDVAEKYLHADEHNHEAATENDNKNKEAEHIEENEAWAFSMIEVIPGVADEGYVEIRLIDSIPENAQIVMNAAYYLLSDLQKSETKHEH
ncbi:MAG TPA: efflux RND transporter periplasmic adaptor subunit [Draconibacterium sp.]|nr:efflux RND transporter periplasmic adaptor subunit [Draconibacterium sp.]